MPANPNPAAPAPIRVEKRPEGRHLVLEGVVGAAQARSLVEAARGLAAEPGPITVDMSALSHLDCAGVQVLLALVETQTRNDSVLRFESVSDSVAATFRNAGLGHLF